MKQTMASMQMIFKQRKDGLGRIIFVSKAPYFM
jgi:hypothetical protein